MLIRIIADNYLSFGDQVEFNMLPGRQTRFAHHKYHLKKLEFLKISAIYGANGAGKSNLIKALSNLEELVVTGMIPKRLINSKFKLSTQNQEKEIVLGVEFINEGKPYLYAIKIEKSKIVTEELYKSGLGQKENSLIFERTRNSKGINQIKFSKEYEKNEEGKLLKKLISDSYKTNEKTFINILNELEHKLLEDVKRAFDWFKTKLVIVEPDSKPSALVHRFKTDKEFNKFTNEMMCSFHTGIEKVDIESINLKEFLGENENIDYQNIRDRLEDNPDHLMGLRSRNEEILVTKEDDEILAHRIYFSHSGQKKDAKFYVDDESDGTQRLLDYIPAFKLITEKDTVFVIDEIERSIHPIIIKELVKKFSIKEDTKGQLIFTTHETNLLDQEIFRQDEIWFVEKDNLGKSHMYPLSEFKEHHTIDIQKGYLDGRYGAIPFLGNLNALSWSTNNAN